MAAMASIIKKLETLSVRDLLADQDLTQDDLRLLFDLSERVKAKPGQYAHALRGKQLAMIFEKPSLRTRTTFEVGITSMGGFAVYLDHTKPRLGEREAIKDVARNLERRVNGIVARTFSHESVLELAANASIPVINALTDLFHPCQALADFFTLQEKFGNVKGLKMAFVGDGNNVCHSLVILERSSERQLASRRRRVTSPNPQCWKRRAPSRRKPAPPSRPAMIPFKRWPARTPFIPMCGPVWDRNTPPTCATKCLRLIV